MGTLNNNISSWSRDWWFSITWAGLISNFVGVNKPKLYWMLVTFWIPSVLSMLTLIFVSILSFSWIARWFYKQLRKGKFSEWNDIIFRMTKSCDSVILLHCWRRQLHVVLLCFCKESDRFPSRLAGWDLLHCCRLWWWFLSYTGRYIIWVSKIAAGYIL